VRFPTKAELEYVGALVVITGVPLFFIERWQQAEDERKTRAIEFVGRFQAENMAEARFRLLEPWLAYRDELRAVAKLGGLDREEANRLVKGIVAASAEAPGDPRLLEAIHEMTDFFDHVAICVRENLCDSAVIRSYFKSYATQFFCLYGVVLEDQRADLGMAGYGSGVETLVTDWGSCPGR
jgi:hypothetical protein